MTKLLYFGANWCAPCKRMKPIISEFEEENPDILVVKIDVDEDSESSFAYNITSVPTIVIIKNDEEFARKRGAISKVNLKKLINGELNE